MNMSKLAWQKNITVEDQGEIDTVSAGNQN